MQRVLCCIYPMCDACVAHWMCQCGLPSTRKRAVTPLADAEACALRKLAEREYELGSWWQVSVSGSSKLEATAACANGHYRMPTLTRHHGSEPDLWPLPYSDAAASTPSKLDHHARKRALAHGCPLDVGVALDVFAFNVRCITGYPVVVIYNDLPNSDSDKRRTLLMTSMTIDGRWKVLEPALQRRSFHQFSLLEGFQANRNGIRALRVGVNATTWLSEPDSALVNLFYKLCQLLRFSITAIFVFDEGNGPDFERGTAAKKTPHPLTTQFQSLVQAFGFHCHTAPGEAEAELAYLNRLGLIDLIFSADVDVFSFGATHVIYSPQEDDFLEAFIYTSEAIKHNAHLTLGGLLLITILRGGNYHAGLPGCGESLAYSLARNGLGDTLLAATQTLQPAELRNFLTVWRVTLRKELLREQHPALAAQVSDAFPDPNILDLYVHPCTSGTLTLGLDASGWSPNVPDIVSISRLCEDLFDWGTPLELPNKLLDVLLPGLCLKRLSQPYNELKLLEDHVLHDRIDAIIPLLSSFLSISSFSRGAYNVEISTRSIITTITSALRGTRRRTSGPGKHPCTKTIMHVRVPRPILVHGLPGMVRHYENVKGVPGVPAAYLQQIFYGIRANAGNLRGVPRSSSRRVGRITYSGALLDALLLHAHMFPLDIDDFRFDTYLEPVITLLEDDNKENISPTVDDN